MQRLISRHQDNPSLWDHAHGRWTPEGERYMATLGRLSGVTRSRLLDGLWAAPEGLVYPMLPELVLPDTHDKPPLPPLRVCAGVDWGFHEPTAIVVGVLCEDDCLYVVEEYYQSGQVPAELGLRLQALVRRWNIEVLFCDSSRPEMIEQLRRWDILARPAPVKPVDLGISKVLERLQNRQLKIYDCCVYLLHEATEYHYEPGGQGRLARLPVQINDHAMDALRYLIVGVDFGRGLTAHRSESAGPALAPTPAAADAPCTTDEASASTMVVKEGPAEVDTPAEAGTANLAELIWGE